MSITQSIQACIASMPTGQLFSYQQLPYYNNSPRAVIKAVNRLVAANKLERFSKGKFYLAEKGLFGYRKPADDELIRSVLYKNGHLRGYVTGLALYNQLGLTTQLPRTITIAYNGGRQQKEFGTIRIKTLVSHIPIQEKNVKLMQYLDVLKDIKNIPDSDINQSLKLMGRYILQLSNSEQVRLIRLANTYYRPQVRALVGLLFASLKLPLPGSLAASLNPTTTYKLNLAKEQWPMAKAWNIC
jgi:hypothetical protein